MNPATFDVLPMAVGELDGEGRLVAANAAWRALFEPLGRRWDELLGSDYVALCERAARLEGETATGFLGSLRDVLDGRRREAVAEYRHGGRWFRVDISTVPGGGVVVVHTDITRQHRAVEQAEAAARLDPLTGLLNRTAFSALLRARLKRAPAEPAALMLIDLDRFKDVNDRFGHAAGDALLRVLARRLRYALRASDRVARMGGDEFLVLIEHLLLDQALAPLANRVRDLLQEPVALNGAMATVGASVGVIRLDGTITDVDTAIVEADRQMYRDKRHRREGRLDGRSPLPAPARPLDRSLAR